MRLNWRYFFRASNNPITECCVISTASWTPASAIFGPPAPKNSGGNGIAWVSGDCFIALTSSAASKSPLASPAMSMKRWEFTSPCFRGLFYSLNLPGDFKRQVQRALGGFAADQRRLVRPHRFDEMLQLQFERLLFLQRHRFAHDSLAPELAHDGRVFGLQQFSEQRRFLLTFAGDAINETLLRAIIERDITGQRPGAEDANFAHFFRANAAGGEIGDAAVGEAQPRVGDVLRLAE